MRAVLALIVIVGLAAAVVFLADNPGRAEISWQNWQIDTSVGVLIAAAAVAGLAIVLLIRLIGLIWRAPTKLMDRRRDRRRRAGYRALTRGMVAVAAGDAEEAQRHAKRAKALLSEPPLTLLLSAQAAQIAGDEQAAKRFFAAMLDQPDTEFLGLRGLLNQAMREGDRNAARRLAQRALTLRPNAAWAASSLLDLETRDECWDSARQVLENAAKQGLIAPDRARHHRGVILLELSLAAAAQDDSSRALRLAAQSRAVAPDLAPAAAHYARLLIAAGKPGRAAKTIERAWATAPHPDLARIYREIGRNETVSARVARFQRLAAQNPTARETHLSLAELAIEAQLWGEARRHLESAVAADPPPFAIPSANSAPNAPPLSVITAEEDGLSRSSSRLCLLMARLAEAEHGDFALAREWLDRAVRALPDPRYLCLQCGGESPEWQALCPHCGAFDSLAWRTPGWTGAGSTALRTIAVVNPAAEVNRVSAEPKLPAVDTVAE